ncbi:MAG: tRNA (N(6)-L-threonylcarbamoyladenosine(37)-C(2))-methylthiotransferase MtaB [Candidatus Kapabacteria bacterium]|nr:tRNA (N(6)-L-threonylcarbamoyladenosine(37)-C(2))-methylthiotransferase MtaB [Candidatus Kapabacteria bacterium]
MINNIKFSYYNIGCKVNFAEISQIADQFTKAGYEQVEFEANSDIVLINTCTVTNRADSDCRKIIRRARKNSPNAFIAVMGCYAQLASDEIVKIEGVDAVFGNNEKFRIPELIHEFKKQQYAKVFVDEIDDFHFDFAVACDNNSHTRAFIKIQDGCQYPCTYCTIPAARGKFRSMPFDMLIEEFKHVEEFGYKELVLSGINLGEYESENKRFVDVIRLIETMKPQFRVRISSIEPNLLTNEIIDIVSNSEYICPHFHIPLQSGSKEILQAMKRRYNLSNYSNLIDNIKKKIPDACIGADIMTGFPGESSSHAIETFNYIESIPISYLHVFSYSERRGTIAATFNQKVPEYLKKERTNDLRRLSDHKFNDFYQSQIGKEKIMIPETFDISDSSVKGHTENYLPIHISGSKEMINQQIKVIVPANS